MTVGPVSDGLRGPTRDVNSRIPRRDRVVSKALPAGVLRFRRESLLTARGYPPRLGPRAWAHTRGLCDVSPNTTRALRRPYPHLAGPHVTAASQDVCIAHVGMPGARWSLSLFSHLFRPLCPPAALGAAFAAEVKASARSLARRC